MEEAQLVSWASKLRERLAEASKRHPLPSGMPESFWQQLLLQTAHVEGLAKLCLERGRAWTKLDRAPERPCGTKRECFKNAAELALQTRGLTYVEGYACTEGLGLALHHAWTVDKHGQVVDPTWENGLAYCGVGVQTDALIEILSHSGVWGVFGNIESPSWLPVDLDRWISKVNGHATTAPGRRRRTS